MSGQSGGVELRDDRVVLERRRAGSFSQAKTSMPVLVRGPVPFARNEVVAAAFLAGESRTVEL